jgi:RNA polymerase sigma factor (sigma-70 family)
MNDYELLRRYVRDGSQADFAQLVERHLNLVYSAARRLVCDSHLAEDVAQQTFVLLAHKGGQLGSDTILSAWLYRAARHLASDTSRREGRRHRREQLAVEAMTQSTSDAEWQQIEPMLDEAMGDLNATEHDAVVLRYFENKSMKEVGEALGLSENAAQKRISRAVERLREFFVTRGVTAGASGLGVVISANAVQAAPVGLDVTISISAIAGTIATATIATHTTMQWLNMKSIAAIVAAAIAAGTGTHLVQQRQANRLRNENQNLVAQQKQITIERDAALSAASQRNDEAEQFRKDKNELLRLRGEVGVLRRQVMEFRKLQEDSSRSRAESAVTKDSVPPTNAGVVYVFGPVRKPGQVPIPANEVFTAGKALLIAGGFGDLADKENVRIVRKTPKETKTIKVNMVHVLEEGKLDEDVVLEPEDLIIVPDRSVGP